MADRADTTVPAPRRGSDPEATRVVVETPTGAIEFVNRSRHREFVTGRSRRREAAATGPRRSDGPAVATSTPARRGGRAAPPQGEAASAGLPPVTPSETHSNG